MTDIVEALPTGLGWGFILVLLVRGLVAALPRIVDAFTRAMQERATAARLSEQARLTQAETERDGGVERRDLAHRVDHLEERLREQERACSEEIASAHHLHALTSARLTKVEAQHLQCERALREQATEMDQLRASIRSMR